MSGFSDATDLRVKLSPDRFEARLIIPSGFPAEEVTLDYCQAALEDAGVEVTAAVIERLKPIVESACSEEQFEPPTDGYLVAKGVEPEPGVDGRVEWSVEATETTASQATQDLATISHYERSPFIFVKEGQHIGTRHEPTEGADGRDVAGGVIAARPGKECPIKFHDSIMIDAKGRLLAQVDGVLHIDRRSAEIRNALEIQEGVDFNTGNVDFKGDVFVQQGVRDCFRIVATGDVDIRGLIEAAHIECHGDFHARSGMAGRGKGTIKVGGDAYVRYLDTVRGEVAGDLYAERELINCDLSIGGGLKSATTSIIDGRVAVTGEVEIASIGSDFDIETEIVLGKSPLVENKLRGLREAIKTVESERNDINGRIAQLEMLRNQMTAEQKEQITELHFEQQGKEDQLDELGKAVEKLEGLIAARGRVHFTVFRMLHSGVRLRLGDRLYRVERETRGPLHIGMDTEGEPVFRRGDGPPQPLTLIARPYSADEKKAA